MNYFSPIKVKTLFNHRKIVLTILKKNTELKNQVILDEHELAMTT